MRFIALVRKELRECLPWMLLTALAMLVITGGIFFEEVYSRSRFEQPLVAADDSLQHDLPTPDRMLGGVGPLLVIISVAFGLILAVRQFLIDHFTRTWGFTLHRSVRKTTVLSSKLLAAAIAFVVSIGSIWTALYIYMHNPGVFRVPPTRSVLVEGWLFIGIGLVVYLGAALTIISTARWYTTRIFPLAFAAGILWAFEERWPVGAAAFLIALVFVVLLAQLAATFVEREF